MRGRIRKGRDTPLDLLLIEFDYKDCHRIYVTMGDVDFEIPNFTPLLDRHTPETSSHDTLVSMSRLLN